MYHLTIRFSCCSRLVPFPPVRAGFVHVRAIVIVCSDFDR
jgi:hypothetical protein